MPNKSLYLALSLFRLDGGKIHFGKTRVTCRINGRMSRCKYLSQGLARLGY